MTGLRPGDRVVNRSRSRCELLLHVRHRTADPVREPPGHRRGAWAPFVRLHPPVRARSPAARPSTCACREPRYGPIGAGGAGRRPPRSILRRPQHTAWQAVTTAPPPGRQRPRCSTRRSATWPAGSPRSRAPDGCSAWTSCRAAATVRQGAWRTYDLRSFDSEGRLVAAIQNETDGRGPDAVIDAVGTRAHGGSRKLVQQARAVMPRAIGGKLAGRFSVDRLAALYTAIDLVRRGGTISLSGVYSMARPDADAHDVRQA